MKYCNHRNNFCLNKKLQKKYLQKQIRKKKIIAKDKRNTARRDRSRFFSVGAQLL